MLAAADSNAATRGPRMKCWESQTWAIASSISCRSGLNWREKSSIGTDCSMGMDTEAMVHPHGLRLFWNWLRPIRLGAVWSSQSPALVSWEPLAQWSRMQLKIRV